MQATTLAGKPPIIIAHRGASGFRPEHTLAAYELAIALGADFIEPDLVMTQDGVLVARHENALAVVNPLTGGIFEATTNVAELVEFRDRQTTKIIDGQTITGWFTEDFTLAELKTLKARERIPQIRPQNTAFNDQFMIPTLQEIIDLAQRKSIELGRTIGIYPETKHPSYFAAIGLPLEIPLVTVLTQNGYVGSEAPVFIQSFEVDNLKFLRTLTDVPLVQLLGGLQQQPYDFVINRDPSTYSDLIAPDGLHAIARYAQAIGPSKRLIIPSKPIQTESDRPVSDAQTILQPPTSLVQDAHAAGLLVHPYTFRNEACFLAADYHKNPKQEYDQFFDLGIDGLFSDYPNTASEVWAYRLKNP